MKSQNCQRVPAHSPRREAVGIVRFTEREYRSLDTEKLAGARTLLLEHARNPGPRYLAVDMSAVRSLGAGFVGVLIESWHELQSRGRTLLLFGLHPACTQLLRRLQLDKLFELYPVQPVEQTNNAAGSPSPGVHVQKSDVDWDPELVRLEYFGGDGIPFRCVILPRLQARRLVNV